MADFGIKTRKRKVSIIHESSSSDEEKTPSKHAENDQLPCQSTPRSSERLQKKKNRAFRKPSRDDVWKKITPSKSPGKYELLRPKRLVNNYTKENSSYNYDPNETSGDESMNDFLDDSLSEQPSSESDDARGRFKGKQKIRIKGRRRRLQNRSECEESSSTDSDTEVVDKKNNVHDGRLENNDDILSGDSAICVESTSKRDIDKGRECAYNDDCDEETEIITVRKKHNIIIIESDENDISDNDGKKLGEVTTKNTERGKRLCEYDDPNDSDGNIAVTRKHNRSIIESDEEDSDVDKNDADVELQVKCGYSSGGNGRGSIDEVLDEERIKSPDVTVECKAQSDLPEKIEEKSDKQLSSTNKTIIAATNSSLESNTAVVDEPDNTTSSCESVSESSEVSDDTNDDLSDGTDDENVGNSSRVRVQMLKKKNERKKLFEEFRKERQRKLSKEH